MLHACVVIFDVLRNFEKFLVFGVSGEKREAPFEEALCGLWLRVTGCGRVGLAGLREGRI